MEKLVAIPLEDGEVVGYLKKIEDVEDQEGMVIAAIQCPEFTDISYVVCWSEDIEERGIH